MDNFELMRILQQLSRSNRNKKLALYFGAAAVVGIGAAIYWHNKNNTAQKEKNKLSDINLSLKLEMDSYANSIKQLNQEISKQAIVIKSYIVKGSDQEKKVEEKA
jgi:5,10-methylene-tetrahydrofolate dehydrogenase/methenyl tetrahydrofolate cyclohydrolase